MNPVTQEVSVFTDNFAYDLNIIFLTIEVQSVLSFHPDNLQTYDFILEVTHPCRDLVL